MRLFITSYQKSGTHQITPMFVTRPDVVDRSGNEMINAPSKYGLNTEIGVEGVQETVENLRVFRFGSSKAFGHLTYLPEYAKVLEETNTKVLFNIRDPRDVVIAEYENALCKFGDGDNMPLWNLYDNEKCEYLYRSGDPIAELIILASTRWPQWLGWLDHDFVKPVKYEDLRLNTRETVEELFEWLEGVGCSDVDTMAKNAIPKPKNPTFRKGEPGEWKSAFTLRHAELAMEFLGDIIEKLGY
jgi:hypothetical protein